MHILLLAALSLDGKIAEVEGQSSMDWTSKEDKKFFVEKTKEVGIVIMGRKTFETFGKPLKDRRLIVMTSMPHQQKSMEGVEFTNETPRVLINRLEKEGCHAIVIAGGASIYREFLEAGLVTDLYLTIEPVIFGEGIPFVEHIKPTRWRLNKLSKLGSDSVLLHFF